MEQKTGMRLLVHNLLECKIKGCKPSSSYPLTLRSIEIKRNPTNYNPDFIKNLLTKIDYKAFLTSVEQIFKRTGSCENFKDLGQIPDSLPEEPFSDEFLKTLHCYLLEIDIVNGEMVCENCKHTYTIVDSIPNMLLKKEEL